MHRSDNSATQATVDKPCTPNEKQQNESEFFDLHMNKSDFQPEKTSADKVQSPEPIGSQMSKAWS